MIFNRNVKISGLNMIINFISFFLTLLQCARCNVKLTAEPAFVSENMTQIFTCSTEKPVQFVEFLTYRDTYAATIGYTENKCVAVIKAHVSNCSCESPTSYKCTTKPLTRFNHTAPWNCRGTIDSVAIPSNILHVDVRVWVGLVVISGEESDIVNIHEGDALQLNCTASNGIPEANITWFFDNKTPNFYRDDIPIMNSTESKTFDNDDNTKTVTSCLKYSVTRQNHLMGVYCNASNMENDLLSSRKIALNVIYVPEGGILIANNTYFMIRNSETIQQLQCSVIGGNPLANLFWTCYNGNQTYSNLTDRAVSTVTWKAGYNTESTCSCAASHEMDWYDVKNVTVKVLYPPLAPLCKVGNSKIAPGTLNVSLSSNLTLSCNSEANPEPNYFRWSSTSGKTTPGPNLSMSYVQVEDGGSYILSIQNSMLPSVGNRQNGMRNDTFKINVHYPPTITSLEPTIKATENQPLNYSCNATPGNPNETSFTWTITGMTNFEISNSRFLVIENVSIANEGYYNCTVRNYMEPTGFNGTFGTDSRRIFLDVKYSARIESFCGYNDTGEDWFIVNHGDEIQLKCLIKGDPQPEIHIKRNDEILASVHSGLELQLKKKSSCLEDIGTFTCYAKNELNLEQPSYKTLDVDVKCAPLYPLGYSPKLNVIATSGEDVILTFTVFSNPPPFSALWIFRQDMQHLPRNVTQVYVSNDNMTTDIRISRIKPDEFGEYSVTVHNTLGSISETFFIIAEGPPEKPSHFFVKEELITDTTAVVVWTPSFNGGHLQTFHVSWRQVLTNNWFSADAGTYAINFTIIELIPGTKYEAKMYSSNIRGKSGESDLITFSTIETRPLDNTVSDLWRMIDAENVQVIVMVTNLIEAGTIKCCQYWSDRPVTYGKCCVSLERIEEYADYVVRHIVYCMEQYLYLHEALAELHDPIGEIYAVEKFVQLYKNSRLHATEDNEFRELCKLLVVCNTEERDTQIKKTPDGALVENLIKSFDRKILPDDTFRPKLTIRRPGENDFINAIFIPTIRQRNKFILTQCPLENTVVDFIRLLWDHAIKNVVVLESEVDKGQYRMCYDVIYERLINKQEKEKVKMEYVNMQFPKYDQ
ncbi:HMCN1-like protein [Mya arenaria]|uniref:HMCN1-like protein n=1 Tax=Mya arenaria TaxID=6604 RepID=A0ABY7E8Q6_MYAAR|nr:HMCN1-like protein [Mya arenaria]